MDGTKDKGAVFLRTKFAEQHESEYTLTRQQMIEDEDWRAAVGAEGGPFCYMPCELDMPF